MEYNQQTMKYENEEKWTKVVKPGVEAASCKRTKSRGTDISDSKTTKNMSKMFSQPIEKEEKNTDKMNLSELLDWSRKAGFPKRAKRLYRGKFHNRKM